MKFRKQCGAELVFLSPFLLANTSPSRIQTNSLYIESKIFDHHGKSTSATDSNETNGAQPASLMEQASLFETMSDIAVKEKNPSCLCYSISFLSTPPAISIVLNQYTQILQTNPN